MAMLSGKKGLIIGIANEHSLAHGCARHFRAAGADLAITYLNAKGTVAKRGRGRAKVAIDRRVGWSSRFALELLVEKLRCLGQGGRAEAEGSLDDAGLPTNVAGDVKG